MNKHEKIQPNIYNRQQKLSTYVPKMSIGLCNTVKSMNTTILTWLMLNIEGRKKY